MMSMKPYDRSNRYFYGQINVCRSLKTDLPTESRCILLAQYSKFEIGPLVREIKKIEELHSCQIECKFPAPNRKKLIFFEIKAYHMVLRCANHDLREMFKRHCQETDSSCTFYCPCDVPEYYGKFFRFYPDYDDDDDASSPEKNPEPDWSSISCTCVERSAERILGIPVRAPLCRCPCERCKNSKDGYKPGSGLEGPEEASDSPPSSSPPESLLTCSCRINWAMKILGVSPTVEKCPCPCTRCRTPHDHLLSNPSPPDPTVCPCINCADIRFYNETFPTPQASNCDD
ncbi:unnamed protein product [Caenorhabditis auriculariae]|uniref:Uncharacterized protein n=1 Tax=Caenorhabditis auriculariae TaxID=2777116 RepID=A0A8S1H0Q3_9PELO|nr:unnamed protein product [Caenorhabditis auriculariae]